MPGGPSAGFPRKLSGGCFERVIFFDWLRLLIILGKFLVIESFLGLQS
jgi:hypothetical protein